MKNELKFLPNTKLWCNYSLKCFCVSSRRRQINREISKYRKHCTAIASLLFSTGCPLLFNLLSVGSLYPNPPHISILSHGLYFFIFHGHCILLFFVGPLSFSFVDHVLLSLLSSIWDSRRKLWLILCFLLTALLYISVDYAVEWISHNFRRFRSEIHFVHACCIR